ncbi:MAG: glutamine synthetase family protein [Clostridiales bacterium]|nr:glutamine synthetase family protein [Clostridiales bacterium]
MYSKEEVMQYVAEEDVKFIRMAFCDIYGTQKNISIMSDELDRAFKYGIAVDAFAIRGFGGEVHSDLFLHPDSSTISILPWRPEHGRVVRMFCGITYPDGRAFESDTRAILKSAVDDAENMGIEFTFGSEMEFYLFKRDENGEPTKIPYDNAGYMDIAPADKGENIRREICLTLEKMGVYPESSHHEDGPGQNEIDFRYSDPLKSADNAITFRSVVNTVADRNGLYADFSPKPLADKAGNGMHINFSAKSKDGRDVMPNIIAGILSRIGDITLFLNTTEDSYRRFGANKAPKYITWSHENRSQLIRIPAAKGEYRRAELRSPDPLCSPYLAFALIIRAGLEGIKNNIELPEAADMNFYAVPEKALNGYATLPLSIKDAKARAKNSDFIKANLPKSIIEYYTDC